MASTLLMSYALGRAGPGWAISLLLSFLHLGSLRLEASLLPCLVIDIPHCQRHKLGGRLVIISHPALLVQSDGYIVS